MLFRGMFTIEYIRWLMYNNNLGIGRYVNPSYKTFIEEFFKVKNNPTPETRQVIEKQNAKLFTFVDLEFSIKI